MKMEKKLKNLRFFGGFCADLHKCLCMNDIYVRNVFAEETFFKISIDFVEFYHI